MNAAAVPDVREDRNPSPFRELTQGIPRLRVKEPASGDQDRSLGRRQQADGLADLCRIVLIHHPPTEGAAHRRRALIDAEALRAVLRRTGADLILHGHMHRTSIGRVAGPRGSIPVVGVRSSSYLGGRPHKRAQYHQYAIERGERDGARFRITLRVRGYDPATGGFASEGTQVL